MASRNISFGLAAFPRLDDLRPVAYPHISSALDARDSIESAPRSYGSVGNIANEVGSERSSIIDRHPPSSHPLLRERASGWHSSSPRQHGSP
jgi:hypothetical protein